MLIVLIWHGFGWGMLIYYTGIKNIDPVLYEAAAIDRADWKTTFLRITLPLMKPVIQINVTMAIISALKQMETVYLLTNGGPGTRHSLRPTICISRRLKPLSTDTGMPSAWYLSSSVFS